MKKLKKIIIIALWVILPLIACVIAAPFVIDLNNYKGKIVTIAKSSLGRDLDFDNIELSLLSGLGADIHGLRIAENPAFGKGDFVSLERLQLKIKLLPLLKKQVQVGELILEKPRIQLIKNKKGEFNFNDIAGSQATSPAKPESKEVKTGDKPPKVGVSPLAGLLVSAFTLNEGHIVFVDESSPEGTTSTTIDMLDLKLSDISINNPINTFIACRLPGSTKQNLTIKGSLGPLGDAMDMSRLFASVALSLHEFNLGDYKRFIPAGMSITPVNGVVSLDVSLKGSMVTGINVEGNVQCDQLTLAGVDGANVLDKASLTLREKMNYSQEKGTLDIHQMDIKLNESNLSLSGRVEGFSTKPQWDVTFRAQGFDTNYAFVFYPSIRDTLPKDTAFSGMMGMEAASKGSMDNLQASCTIEMKDVDLRYGETFHKPKDVPCKISFNATKSGENVQLNPLAFTVHTMSLKASGSVNGLSNPRFDLLLGANTSTLQGWDDMVPALKAYDAEGSFAFKASVNGPLNDAAVNLQFTVPKIALKIAASDEKAPAQKSVIEAMELKVQAEKKDSDIKASGSLAVKKGVVQSSPFEKMQAQFNFQQDILNVHGFQVNIFQGIVSMDSTFDMKTSRWSARPVIKNIQVAEAMDNFTSYKGTFRGLFSGTFSANSVEGSESNSPVNASGSFRLDKGELLNLTLVDTILESLFGMQGVSTYLGGESGKLKKQQSTFFDAMDSHFTMVNSKVTLNDLAMHNVHTEEISGSDAYMEGLVACDTGELALKGKIMLSPDYSAKLAKKAEPLNTLINPEKRMVLPMTITGNMSKPKPLLDATYVAKATAQYYAKKELEKLGGKLTGSKQQDDKSQQQPQKKEDGTINKLFKGLFK